VRWEMKKVKRWGVGKTRETRKILTGFDLNSNFKIHLSLNMGPRSSVVVKALCYKPEGRGFDSR
jgi:hypothetical protein